MEELEVSRGCWPCENGRRSKRGKSFPIFLSLWCHRKKWAERDKNYPRLDELSAAHRARCKQEKFVAKLGHTLNRPYPPHGVIPRKDLERERRHAAVCPPYYNTNTYAAISGQLGIKLRLAVIGQIRNDAVLPRKRKRTGAGMHWISGNDNQKPNPVSSELSSFPPKSCISQKRPWV